MMAGRDGLRYLYGLMEPMWRYHVVNRTAIAKPPISEGGI